MKSSVLIAFDIFSLKIYNLCYHFAMNPIFTKRLKKLRQDNKLNQRQLAKEIQVSQVAICLWERGERTPDIISLAKLCDFFDVSADYLLGRADF